MQPKTLILFSVLAVLLLMGSSAAFPSDWVTNPNVLKIGLISSTSAMGIFAYHDPAGHWQVAIEIGTPSWGGDMNLVGLRVYTSDRNGRILIPL